MGKTLAELRATPPVSRPERSVTICLAPHLVAEVQALTEELQTVALDIPDEPDDDEPDGPPLKVGERVADRRPTENPRANEIRARLAELLDEIAEAEGELRIRATEDGAWRRWVDEHPPREEGVPGHKRDREVAGGYCNADDLIDDLGTYAVSWDGEPLGDADWAVIAASTPYADKKRIATLIVSMQERGMDLGKWRLGLRSTLRAWQDDDSLAASAVRPASSLAEFPQSDTSTTPPTAS